MKIFDRKFGAEFIDSVPNAPGVYRFFLENGEILYVGKATNLNRRLSQYRSPKRTRRHKKMRDIVKQAFRLEWQCLETAHSAELHEIRLIQELKPSANIAGKYSFLYPYVGIKMGESRSLLCYTTVPQNFSDFMLFGAFRSRRLTKEGYHALAALLGIIFLPSALHKSEKSRIDKTSHLYAFSGKQVLCSLRSFLRGDGEEVLQEWFGTLLAKPCAVRRSEEIQEAFDSVKAFYRKEVLLLERAIALTGHVTYPVGQSERDPLLLSYRHQRD